jgi:hypothetical protein
MSYETKLYKNTGLRYMEGKEKILFKHGGVIILTKEFEDWDAKGILMAQVLGLADKPERAGYDFDHAVETGTLRRKRHDDPVRQELAPVAEPVAPPPLQDTVAQDEPVAAQEERVVMDYGPYQPIGTVVDNASPIPLQVSGNVMIGTTTVDEECNYKLNVNPNEGTATVEPKSFVQQALDKFHSIFGRVKKPVVQKKKHVSVHSSPIVMLVVIVIVGLGSLVMSGYHINTYMVEGGRAAWIAMTTGVIMALFSAIAFTAARHFWGERKFVGKTIAALFTGFGIIVIVFAMFATIKVNYDQFKAGDDAKITAVVEKSSAVKTANAKDAFVQRELARLDAAIEASDKDARAAKAAYDIENSKGKEVWNADVRWRAWVSYIGATKASEKLQAERKPYADAVMKPSDSAAAVEAKVVQDAKDATVFGMFAKLFAMDETLLKFIVYVIPAVFYDLMSPFALTVAMMLYEDRKREEEEEEEDE